MSSITDDHMHEMLGKTKPYTIVILHKTTRLNESGMDKVVRSRTQKFRTAQRWKVTRSLPIRDADDIAGIGIFSTDLEETRKTMDADPAVRAGILTYEVHETRSFPGDAI